MKLLKLLCIIALNPDVQNVALCIICAIVYPENWIGLI